jgi:glycosyltransferase involved in cell wall biosynthesis
MPVTNSETDTDRGSRAPTVSVVIPVHNRVESVSRAIDSALTQTIDDVEVLVVDDASTDGTPDVVEAYDDARVRLFRHETNRGGSAARNTGIDHASGVYIAFLDSDDEWLPRKLERQLDCLQSRSDAWVAAYCGFERVRRGEYRRIRGLFSALFPPRERTGIEGGVELVDQSLLLNGVSTGGMSTVIATRDAVEKLGGFDASFERRQDWEFRLRLLKQGKLACVDEVLVRKYQSGGGPSADTVERATVHYLETFADDIERLERDGHDVTGLHLAEVAQSHLAEGNFVRGTRFLLRCHLGSARQCLELGFGIVSGVTVHARRLTTRLRSKREPVADVS